MTSVLRTSYAESLEFIEEKVEICKFCERPLCPYCWNHAEGSPEDSQIWKCSNSLCKHQFTL